MRSGERRGRWGKNWVLLVVVMLAALIGSLLYKQYLEEKAIDRESPEIKKVEYKDSVTKDENQIFSVLVNEKNPSPSSSLNLNGAIIEVPLKSFDNGTAFYQAEFNPSNIWNREGKVFGYCSITDKNGNEVREDVSFLVNLEAPRIEDLEIEKLDFGKYSISTVIEEPNLKEAYIQLSNGTKIPLLRTDGRYAANISTKTDLDFVLNAIDAYNLNSSFKASIKMSERDKFGIWLPSEFDKELSLSLFDSSRLFREIFKTDKTLTQSLLNLAKLNGSSVPKNLAYLVLNQIERASGMNIALVKEVLPLYLEFGKEIQKFSQIYTLNNATWYFGSSRLINEIGSDSLLTSLRKLGENDGINRDFDTPIKHLNLLRLAKCVENILKYPKEWREGAIQIDDVGYITTKLAFRNETKFWYIVKRAVKYIVEKLDSGEAEYELGIPDEKIEAWYRRQRLLPRELFEIDIVSGWRNIISGEVIPSLEIGERNVSPDPRIGGMIPQQWLEDMAKRDFREKTLRYQLAMIKPRIATYPEEYWPKSYQAFMDALDIVLAEDPEAAFILGYVRALRSEFIPWNLEPVVPMEGTTTPYYAVLLARCFGKAAFVARNTYPPGFGVHDSPYVKLNPSTYAKISQKGETLVPYMFGEFPYKKELKEDHINYGKLPANPHIKKPNGRWEKISL